MPPYEFKVPHNLSMEQIKEKVEHFAGEYNASTEWKSESECHFSGHYKGIPVSGVFKVFDEEVQVKVELPLMAMPFKSKIREAIAEELRQGQ